MSSATYKVPAFRSSGIGGAGNFVKATKSSVVEATPTRTSSKSAFIMRGIGGAGNIISRSLAEAQPRGSVSSERAASIHSVSSGHYHGIGGRGNWSWDEKRRDSSETDRSLI